VGAALAIWQGRRSDAANACGRAGYRARGGNGCGCGRQVALFAFVNRGENVHEGIHLATCANQLLQMQPDDGAGAQQLATRDARRLVYNVRRTSTNVQNAVPRSAQAYYKMRHAVR
jgi:hypothetical protein